MMIDMQKQNEELKLKVDMAINSRDKPVEISNFIESLSLPLKGVEEVDSLHTLLENEERENDMVRVFAFTASMRTFLWHKNGVRVPTNGMQISCFSRFSLA